MCWSVSPKLHWPVSQHSQNRWTEVRRHPTDVHIRHIRYISMERHLRCFRVACLDSSGNQALVKHSSESDLSGSWYHGFRLISRSLLQVPETQNYWFLGTLHRMGQGFPGKGRGSLHKWGLLEVWTPGHPGMHICGKTLSLGVGSHCSAYELWKVHGDAGELWLHPIAPAVPQESPWTSILLCTFLKKMPHLGLLLSISTCHSVRWGKSQIEIFIYSIWYWFARGTICFCPE